MMKSMTLFLAQPIEAPIHLPSVSFERVDNQDYAWDDWYFSSCSLSGTEWIFVEDSQTYYYVAVVQCTSMDEAKMWRQMRRVPYLGEQILPLERRLDELGLKPSRADYDKAVAHLCVRVDQLDKDLPKTRCLSRWANLDGDDDPQVVPANHYIASRYGESTTVHVAGWGTHSFATVTDNEFYFEHILVPKVGVLYLLYYTFWLARGKVNSRQMMPLLLQNLWNSTSTDRPFNQLLVQVSRIEVE